MRVLVASGGSGGHIFPAVSLAKELARRGAETIFVASRRRLDKKILQNAPYKTIFLSVNPMPYKFGWRVIVFLIKLALDSFQAMYILVRYRPDAVVGFGGYTAGAIVLLGSIMRAKTIIHEQNVVPGRTNRFLDRLVGQVAVSFSETRKYFKNKNVTLTGNPVREESLKECRAYSYDKFNLEKGKFTILVMGGSQGASSLNRLVSGGLRRLPQEEKDKLQVLHITGSGDFEKFRSFYSANGIKGRVFDFVENINEVYSACDLAVSRSGAAAICELASHGKPMVLIPYPASRNNQRFNAIFLRDKGAALYRDQEKLSEGEIGSLISELMTDSEKRKDLSGNARKLAIVDGARRLAEIVL
ncbi:MAG: undecaprenyldiphospho-muramoylpentapeptide beta-N-acetylglucosaminyltransferase [Omnitrophica bacterium]|nr:undecaprenyldiphospho-muramoylpentapeptide beta-N-acetylglucosaminyltransferase [Candidatus Omnitrophota bacterium]